MPQDNHETENRDLSGGVRGRTEEAKVACNPFDYGLVNLSLHLRPCLSTGDRLFKFPLIFEHFGPLSPESLLPPGSLVLSRGFPHLPPPEVAWLHSFSWPSGLHAWPPVPDHVPLYLLHPVSYTSLSFCLPNMMSSFFLLSGIEAPSHEPFCLLNILSLGNCILGTLYILDNIHPLIIS